MVFSPGWHRCVADAALLSGQKVAAKSGLLRHVALREGLVVVFLRQVGDLPPHLVHVLQPERADAAPVLEFLDLSDPVVLLVLFGRRMRGVDLGGARDRELEAVLRPLLLLLALDADTRRRPGPALPQL